MLFRTKAHLPASIPPYISTIITSIDFILIKALPLTKPLCSNIMKLSSSSSWPSSPSSSSQSALMDHTSYHHHHPHRHLNHHHHLLIQLWRTLPKDNSATRLTLLGVVLQERAIIIINHQFKINFKKISSLWCDSTTSAKDCINLKDSRPIKCEIRFIYVGFKKVGSKNVWKLCPLRGGGVDA